ncbi:tripartite tricarboxylate transporter permease [Alteribacter populi]|uniref:tripartite tricarboxylate transporter permease n=1 Tax=Alteribacter populi TaxID=2011011 RepID=UPI0018E21296|nr:tripartite tricarboxylate transporter permease [Alteribacter populi]
MIDNLLLGIEYAITWQALLVILIGVTWGIIGGAIPGITGSIACALMLPFTYSMEPALALMMLAGTYVAAEYGGGIPAILIGAPGTSSNAPVVLDGYELHKQGHTGKALGTSLIIGTIGGIFSVIVLVLIAVPLAKVALAFGPPEYFALALFALTVVAALVAKSLIKGLISAAFGLFIAVIGMDPFTGEMRFTGGSSQLIGGLELIPVLIGLFAVSELLIMAKKSVKKSNFYQSVSTKFPTWKELKSTSKATSIGSVAGTFFGIMPGVGGSIGSWIAYNEAKRWSKNKEKFGKGSLEGVAAPEAANNAVTGGAMVPLLALGIPGSNTTAIMIGALIVHGVTPGPLMFEQQPEIPYSLFVGMLIAQFMMLVVGYFVIKPAIKISTVSTPMLLAIIFPLVFVGSYSLNNNLFDVGVVLFFGVVGLLMKRFGFSPPATVLGLVLGVYIETNLRRSLEMSDGSLMIFLERPIALICLLLAVISLTAPFVQERLMKNIKKDNSNNTQSF